MEKTNTQITFHHIVEIYEVKVNYMQAWDQLSSDL